MGKGLLNSIDYLKNGFDKAPDTKNAIIYAVGSQNEISKEFRENEQNLRKSINKNFEYFTFDKNEAENERIIINNYNKW